MQQSSFDPVRVLADRLRSLRQHGWPGRAVTQRELGNALDVSPPLISAWENPNKPAIPPEERLESYATFFATERSVSQRPYRLIEMTRLTAPERTRRRELLEELTELRNAALAADNHANTGPAEVPTGGLWRFPDTHAITIVSSELPEHLRQALPYTDSDSPDHVESYRYSDLDALLEVYGHIRSVNPNSHVFVRAAPDLTPDDYTSHLVLLGGVDWNPATADVLSRLELPLRQEGRDLESSSGIGYFEVLDGSNRQVYRPKLLSEGTRAILIEDVAHFYHGVSPFNVKRTVTICNGMYQRGTFGAVRALTDVRFRDRNERYINARFANQEDFSILFRVLIANGQVVTPDWTQEHLRLHAWPPEA
ncbi:MAG TPA: helix-turn-helix transcriptional regulator [Actinophytocola sp.]|uniref:helix-turn-helix transcriptional regulator n=1 Tax=Actinophytocola sp. TaxID=1872138 RepID=UPI002DBB7E4D|nr:helix-turn-helix transcriptional regulator [Actinophytocola sp.]HEU5470818.1 helix-turn-helix transcriptional regulator [Actinophytocola sp.]